MSGRVHFFVTVMYKNTILCFLFPPYPFFQTIHKKMFLISTNHFSMLWSLLFCEVWISLDPYKRGGKKNSKNVGDNCIQTEGPWDRSLICPWAHVNSKRLYVVSLVFKLYLKCCGFKVLRWTYLPRALNEWLKDLAARWRSVCKKTSTFSGLKLSPSSARRGRSTNFTWHSSSYKSSRHKSLQRCWITD